MKLGLGLYRHMLKGMVSNMVYDPEAPEGTIGSVTEEQM